MITLERKLVDGRIISYMGQRGEPIRLDGWHDEEGNVVPLGSACQPFDDLVWAHAYNDKGERIPF